MELSPSDKRRIEHQFDSFCKLVLVCEMKDYKKMILKKWQKKLCFRRLCLSMAMIQSIRRQGRKNEKNKTGQGFLLIMN